MKRAVKYTLFAVLLLPVLFWLLSEIMMMVLELDPPKVQQMNLVADSVQIKDGLRVFGNNWYGQNGGGHWEAFIEGKPYERGRVFGLLAEQEIVSQEDAFVGQIKRLVPSEGFLKTLKYGVVFFNRNLDDHVPLELQKEIYGVSRSFADKYDFIGEKYSRILNYHAAHDIGHALQDLSIVGCSSFAVWDGFSEDSSLIVARNFDFYMGDEFAKNKLVLFTKPDSGFAFASVTWAGFMGVVSGMNEHGLTVTLNAAKSEIPDGAKTPISILAREILQYAKNIDEAYEIARARQTFVSESILIGSAEDHSAAVIEKSPDRIDIYRSANSQLICTNHYQSDEFKDDEVNLLNIRNSDSEYRYKRLSQMIERDSAINLTSAVEILRNQRGLDDADLGMGNPKAINQLLAHHGIVFQPEKRLMWVSANPFQLGDFYCYDLNRIFSSEKKAGYASVDSLKIDADPFMNSEDFAKFLRYKELKNLLFEN
ncbi:MAG: peptidase C45, partial [Flavobacteriales bacterium]|nr:peptidase C45 [Flavobacteriales bacterium]